MSIKINEVQDLNSPAERLITIKSRLSRSSNPALKLVKKSESNNFQIQKSLLSSFREQLLNLPITINGLADPAILKESTAAKLDKLVADQHQGPVAIVTKGDLSTPWWQERLGHWAKNLDLYIFASISGLPRSFEPISTEQRFRTLRAARDAGAKSIMYLRPIVPNVNDSTEGLLNLMKKAKDHGAHAAVSSGFRGTSSIVDHSGFAHNGIQKNGDWLPSVKLHSTSTETILRKYAEELDIGFWTGTACAVAALGAKKHSLAPYHQASHFAQCDSCSLKNTCHDLRLSQTPKKDSLELLRYLGYQAEFYPANLSAKQCNVGIRSNCSLHCTNCPRAPEDFGAAHVLLKLWDGGTPSWGDLCLARFLTGGLLCTNANLSPTEESNISLHPRFKIPNLGAGSLYATTSWLMWSEYLPKEQCFRCSYCFVGMYKNQLPAPMQGTVGMSPVEILNFFGE